MQAEKTKQLIEKILREMGYIIINNAKFYAPPQWLRALVNDPHDGAEAAYALALRLGRVFAQVKQQRDNVLVDLFAPRDNVLISISLWGDQVKEFIRRLTTAEKGV